MPLFLNRYVEHDTLIWEYLNSSIHLVSFHLDFEIFWNSPRHLIHLDGFNVITKFTESHPRPLTWRRSSKGSTKGTHTSKFTFYKDAFYFDLYIKLTLLFRFYRLSDRLILNNALDTEMGSSDIDSAMRFFLQCLKSFASSFCFQVFPSDHWIHAAASPFLGRAAWWHRVRPCKRRISQANMRKALELTGAYFCSETNSIQA